MDRLVFVCWIKRERTGNLALLKALKTTSCLELDIITVDFP